MSDDDSALTDFSGTVRLFPLPNLVLFPHVMQPLHVFEPRYRQMAADALAGDRLIALVLLQPGWEADYEGRPAIYSMACLGRIVAQQRLDDGRFNLLLCGLCRARLSKEDPAENQYRVAPAQLLTEEDDLAKGNVRKLRIRMSQAVPKWIPPAATVLQQFRKLLRGKLPLGALCDIIAFALPLDVAFKQELLEELDVGRRIRRLLDHLETSAPEKPALRSFPPEFSVN
jgi:uncharacterized protein